MGFGFEIGDGWFDILNRLSAKIEAIILTFPPEEREYIRASQIKEKFGTLRVYITSGNDEIHDLISEAEALSAETCEECGLPGTDKGSTGWISTLCKGCRQKQRSLEQALTKKGKQNVP